VSAHEGCTRRVTLGLVGGGRPPAAFAYLLAAGLPTGSAASLTTALWAEFYGAGHLAAVRAAVAGAAVVS
jgi:hypothetical protein